MIKHGATGTTLRTIERGLDVLEIVARSATPPTVKEVAERLDHHLSSTYHIVNTLSARGYLSKNDRGELSIGTQVGILNASLLGGADFAETVRPLISKLAFDCGETVYVTRWLGGSAVIQMVIESQRSLRVKGLGVGYSGSEDTRASGKAVLAQLTRSELDPIHRKLHPNMSDRERSAPIDRLTRELDEIRKQGYAFDDEDYEPGVCCIAAAYFLPDGTVGGSVAASAPALRVADLLHEVRNQVIEAAESVSAAMQ